MPKPKIAADELRRLMEYDPESGVFIWRSKRGRHPAGSEAGTIAHNGYCDIAIHGKKYGAHRLAFLYMRGNWPAAEVDHINCKKADNRWVNLREATRWQNSGNVRPKKSNKLGLKGVSYSKKDRCYYAFMREHGRTKYLGAFHSPQAAHARYAAEAVRVYGEFARV